VFDIVFLGMQSCVHRLGTQPLTKGADHDTVITAKVLKRTAKFVTVKTQFDAAKRCGIVIIDGVETIKPWGSYSMAPTIRAA
jgi:hypothetical protein